MHVKLAASLVVFAHIRDEKIFIAMLVILFDRRASLVHYMDGPPQLPNPP